jgi:prepilin-type N-terminal cleavage/methylation domain-containing protein
MPLSSLRKEAFTLIEMLLVVVIIAILASIVVVAINPARQINNTQDTQRATHANTLVNAIYQYAADNGGTFPASLTASATVMGDDVTEIDVCADLVPTYIADMVVDPDDGLYTDCTTYDTQYTVLLDANDRVTVAAPAAENTTVSVTR